MIHLELGCENILDFWSSKKDWGLKPQPLEILTMHSMFIGNFDRKTKTIRIKKVVRKYYRSNKEGVSSPSINLNCTP
jgi:hypothetical protein